MKKKEEKLTYWITVEYQFCIQELEHAQKWARERSIPFPELDLEDIKIDWDKGIRKPVYVFPGANAPTIAHIVMMDVCHSPTGKSLYFVLNF